MIVQLQMEVRFIECNGDRWRQRWKGGDARCSLRQL